MEEVKWYKSKRVWSQIISLVLGILVAVDNSFGTNIMGSEVIGFIIALISALGINYTMSATRKVV